MLNYETEAMQEVISRVGGHYLGNFMERWRTIKKMYLLSKKEF